MLDESAPSVREVLEQAPRTISNSLPVQKRGAPGACFDENCESQLAARYAQDVAGSVSLTVKGPPTTVTLGTLG